MNIDEFRIRAQQLVDDASAFGFNITVTQKPLMPPAMGHHETVVDVWPARHPRATGSDDKPSALEFKADLLDLGLKALEASAEAMKHADAERVAQAVELKRLGKEFAYTAAEKCAGIALGVSAETRAVHDRRMVVAQSAFEAAVDSFGSAVQIKASDAAKAGINAMSAWPYKTGSDVLAQARDTIDTLCNGIEWNIENHPTVMNESDEEALAEGRRQVATIDAHLSKPAEAQPLTRSTITGALLRKLSQNLAPLYEMDGEEEVSAWWKHLAGALRNAINPEAAPGAAQPVDADEDSKFLRNLACGLTYNDTKAEGVTKHRLHEIAMRISSGTRGAGDRSTNELVPLASDHKGMRVDHSGLLKQCQQGLRREPVNAEMLRQLGDHIKEMGERFYAGDLPAVDEFLQLYCVARERREAAQAKAGERSTPAEQRRPSVEEMAQRLMGWPLPKGFSPDCGISFDGRKDDKWNKNKTWPVGTNLLTVEQAMEMFQYVLAPPAAQAKGGE